MARGFSLIGMQGRMIRSMASILAALLMHVPHAFGAQGFRDPLDHPAEMQSAINTRSLMSIAQAGKYLVAVGSRGLIVRSEDGGKNWAQMRVPVQSDLLAVNFPTAQDGWAVGHDGVILNTRDAGQTWAKQLDGRIAAESFKKFYADAGSNEAMQEAARQVEANFKAGPALPYLGVWFESAEKGFAVGSFGMLVVTSDGGKTWEPWMHRIANQEVLNLNSVRGIGKNVFIVGEHGMVYVLDRAKGIFNKVSTGYAGSFFGIVGTDSALLAFGLKGMVYRSDDGGRAWVLVKMPAVATLTSGIADPKTQEFLLANSSGQLLRGNKSGNTFELLGTAKPMRYTDLLLSNDGTLVLTGVEGVRSEALSSNAK